MYISTSYVIRTTHAEVLRGWACDHRMYVCMYVCMYISPLMVYGQHILRFYVLCVCCDHRGHCVFVAIIAFCVIVVHCTEVLRIACMLRPSRSVRICCDHRAIVLYACVQPIQQPPPSLRDHRYRHAARCCCLVHRDWRQQHMVA